MYTNVSKKVVIRLSILLVFVFSSCVRDGDELDKCMCDMRIELRWMGTLPQNQDENVEIEVIPASLGTRIDLHSDIYGVSVDLFTDRYNIVGWEEHLNTNIDVINHTINVNTSADGTAVSPTIFGAGYTTPEVILSDKSQVIPLPMYRQVRPVIVQVNFIGDGYAFINGMTGTLKGIALERSLDNAFPPVNGLDRPAAIKSGSIHYTFGLLDQPRAGIWYSGTQNLIGIDGDSSQTLDLNITFTGDNASSSFNFDVTNQFAGYHTEEINEPWYIILTLNMGINLEITIEDWIAGPESWITAH